LTVREQLSGARRNLFVLNEYFDTARRDHQRGLKRSGGESILHECIDALVGQPKGDDFGFCNVGRSVYNGHCSRIAFFRASVKRWTRA